jgi:hypothetical protein
MRALVFLMFGVGMAHAGGGGGPESTLPLDLALQRMRELGFECIQKSPKAGGPFQCLGRIPGYSKRVALYIPIHFDERNGAPRLITHFHGHVVRNDDFARTLTRYRLDVELSRSGLSLLLLIPESVGKCDTYREELSSRSQFEEFQMNLLGVLKNAGLIPSHVESRSLPFEITGHSGAFRAISGILQGSIDDGRIDRVGLFDATYCSFPLSASCRALGEYARRFPGRIRSYFLENSPTSAGSRELFPPEDRIELSQIRFTHFTVMRGNYSDWMKGPSAGAAE